MKTLLLIALVSFGLSGCTKPPCAIATSYSDTAAAKIGAALGCCDIGAMAADFKLEVAKLNLCTREALPTGPLSAVVCKPLAARVVSYGVGRLPASWQCSGAPASAISEAALYAACAQLPW